MTSKAFRITVLALLAVAGMATMAESIIGRPVTPLSYAGVARRTTARAVDATAGAAAYDSAYATPTPACVPPAYPATAYNAYGQAYTACKQTLALMQADRPVHAPCEQCSRGAFT